MTDYYTPRSDWPPGPWDDEPDRVGWTDPATGYPCIIRRGPLGNWCGYVGVPPGHPHHGAGYDDPDVHVHGGLTYARGCDDDPAHGVCHVPAPGQPDDVWWFGFDCGHAFDVSPGMPWRHGPEERAGLLPDDVYRTVDYVTAETTRLAAQLAKLAGR